MRVKLRPIHWQGNSLEVVRGWPVGARTQAGGELFRLQLGNDPLHWRPMRSIGRGVREIKIAEGGQFRVLYFIRQGEGIVVLRAFAKKSMRTARADIDVARQRLKPLSLRM